MMFSLKSSITKTRKLILESVINMKLKGTAAKIKKMSIRFKEIIISIMLLLLVPSICSFVLGYAFSSHLVKNIPTIIVDHDNSSLSENFVNQINTNEAFNVTEYSDNNDDVKSSMDKGTVVVGIIIPEEFSKDLLAGKAPKIMIFYDGAQMSAVSIAKSRIAEILGTIKASYLISLGEGKLGLMPEVVKDNVISIQTKSIFIGNPTKSTANFIVQGMLIGIVQTGIGVLGVLLVKKKENYFLILAKSIVGGIIGSISILIALMIQFKYFAMPYKGSVMAAIILTILFSIVTINLGILFRLIINSKLAAINVYTTILSSTVVLAGYTFPLMAMPNIFKYISKFIPFLYYGIPMRDLSLLGLSFNEIVPDLYSSGSFVFCTWLSILVVLVIKRVLKNYDKYEGKGLNKVLNKISFKNRSKVG